MVRLEVSRHELVITTSVLGLFQLGRYTFAPSQVAAITRYGHLAFWGEGVQIQHTVAEYPKKIVFLYRAGPVLEGIASTGFTAQAPPEAREAVAKISGSPYRRLTLAVLFVIWNVAISAQVFLHYPHVAPGRLMGVLLALFSAFALGALRFPWLQALLLKPGRSIEEVRPQLRFVGVLLGVMALIFSLMRGGAVILSEWERGEGWEEGEIW